MSLPRPPEALQVPLEFLVDLAVEWWRLERSVSGKQAAHSGAVARHVARSLASLLKRLGIEAKDLTGLRYEPGMAVEVVDTLLDGQAQGDDVIIAQTIGPLVLWQGTVVRLGRVVTGRSSVTACDETKEAPDR